MSATNFSSRAVTSMRLISSGGAGVTPAFVREASQRFGATVKRTYGSTEAPVVTTWHLGDPADRAGSTDGRAIGAVELLVTDPASGSTVAAGDVGKLWVRGPELFVGYTDVERNRDACGDDGWFSTGDLASLDAEGWLSIEGRLDDTIIRGGENISAAEVEAALEAHPDVAQAVAVGVADDRLGERVCAFVVCRADVEFTLESARSWFEQRGVTKFKWPEEIVQLDQLPVLETSGKPDRSTLRALASR
jgi:cyclohexanecarboxylate-CoA ligase